MKRKFLCWLAAGILAVPMSAQALLVTVDGQQWEITTFTTSFNEAEVTLRAQPWWDNDDKAKAFVLAWGDTASGTTSPFFATFQAAGTSRDCFDAGSTSGTNICSAYWKSAPPFAFLDSLSLGPEGSETYAVAAPVPLPGALGLLGFGLAGLLGLGTRRRRQATPI